MATGLQQVPEAGSPQATHTSSGTLGRDPRSAAGTWAGDRARCQSHAQGRLQGAQDQQRAPCSPSQARAAEQRGWGHAAGWQPSPPALREHPAPCQELPGSAATQQEY